jgi:electron transfer flavoprotein alpha subunit
MDFSYLDEWTKDEFAEEISEEVGENYRHVWLVSETAEGALLPATLEATGQARDLADQIGVYVYGVLLGRGLESLGQKLVACGADRILAVEDAALDEYQPEVYVKAIAGLVGRYRPEILLLPGTPLGNDLAPRLAQRLATGLISHCTRLSVDMSERLLLGEFPVLDGEMAHTFACPEARPQMATLQPGHFAVPYEDPFRSGAIDTVSVDLAGASGRLAWLDRDATVELPPVPLSRARTVVSAGRGMGDAAGFALVEQLARALDGVVAGSRGAFDEGWIDDQQMVGVGGESISPDLYVACGVSGDIYHYFGAQDAKFLVAINPDEKAPIMRLANVAIVGDAKRVIPGMLQALAGRAGTRS